MAAPTDNTKQSATTSAPESPTTVRPFEMDDDDVQETGLLGDDATNQASTTSATPAAATNTAPATSDEAPPAKPPRPLTETQKNEQILKEAFPSIDATVIKAVLVASGGRVDPAFNALLSMSDPDAVQNEPAEDDAPPPPQPPRPTGRAPMSQMEADELYARQLAERYDNAAYEARTQNRSPGQPFRRQATGLKPNEMYDREHSFIDDDLPVIRENLRQGFLETQTKVNSWFTNLKKRIDGEYDSEEDESQPSRHNQPGSSQRGGEAGRRSTDYHRYDADPQVLSDDFAGIRLNPDGTAPQGRSGNPNVYRPPPKSASPRPEGRKVAFKDGHEDIDDPYNASPKLPPKDSAATPPSGGKASKWQPMSAVDPSPIAEHDPFSLGDSEDEKETKDKPSKDTKLDDSERLKQATADAMADSLVDESKKSDAAK